MTKEVLILKTYGRKNMDFFLRRQLKTADDLILSIQRNINCVKRSSYPLLYQKFIICLTCLLSSDEELLSFRCVNGVVVGVAGDVLGDSGAIWSSVLILQLTYCGDKNRQHSIQNYSTWITYGQQRTTETQARTSEWGKFFLKKSGNDKKISEICANVNEGN